MLDFNYTYFHLSWVICSHFKAQQSTCQALDMAVFFKKENSLLRLIISVMLSLFPYVLRGRSQVSLFFSIVVGPEPFISSPDPKGHVSYCHHLASVVRHKRFQKSSPLKVLDQWKPNLVRIITRVSSFKIVSGDAVHQPTWPLLLKIEHMVKLQVLGNNSKTVNNIKNMNGVKMISTARSTYPAILK